MSETTGQAIAPGWWLVLARGACAFGLGAMATARWPMLDVPTLVGLFAVYAVLDGLGAMGQAVVDRKGPVPTWWLMLIGVLGVGVGVATLAAPAAAAAAMVRIVGTWAVAKGIYEVAGAVALRKEIEHEWSLGTAGVLSILFGAMMLVHPMAGLQALAWYLMVFGIVLVGLGFKMRRLGW